MVTKITFDPGYDSDQWSPQPVGLCSTFTSKGTSYFHWSTFIIIKEQNDGKGTDLLSRPPFFPSLEGSRLRPEIQTRSADQEKTASLPPKVNRFSRRRFEQKQLGISLRRKNLSPLVPYGIGLLTDHAMANKKRDVQKIVTFTLGRKSVERRHFERVKIGIEQSPMGPKRRATVPLSFPTLQYLRMQCLPIQFHQV